MFNLYRDAAYPLYHWLKRDGINEARREIQANQWLDPAELRSLQQRKLRSLLLFAGQHVPYYRKLLSQSDMPIERLAEFENFRQIPVLTKKTIRQECSNLVSESLSGNSLLENSTSGSTGEALRFYTDYRSTRYRKAVELQGMEWAGWRMGEPVVRLWGSPIDQKKASKMRGFIHGLVTKQRYLSTYEMSDSKMDSYVKSILRFSPTLLISYAGPLEQFARYCLTQEVTLPSLRGVISSAEKLWPHQRRLIEDAFKTRVFDRYGCREFGAIAQECEEHAGLHIQADRFYVELVNENGQACQPDQTGKLVITDLDNFGMPFVRYEIGDAGVWREDGTCNCGRGLPRLAAVDGRTMDVVLTPSGNRLGGTFWTFLFKSAPGIRQFQLVQESIQGITVKFVRDDNYSERHLRYFSKRIKEKCGEDFKINFAEVDVIDLTHSGKQRLIVSHCSNEASGTND